MPTPEQTAAKTGAMSKAIMAAIAGSGDAENIHVIMGALGSVAGCMAQASGRPDECLNVMTAVARGVISGELLD